MARLPPAGLDHRRRARATDRRGRPVRGHVQPEHLPQGDLGLDGLRPAGARARGEGHDRPAGDLLRPGTGRCPDGRGSVPAAVRSIRRCQRLRLIRAGSGDRARHRSVDHEGKGAVRAHRSPERDDQGPGDGRGCPHRRSAYRRRHQRQHHVAVQRRAVRGGCWRVHRGAGEATGRRPHRPPRLRCVVLRLACRFRRGREAPGGLAVARSRTRRRRTSGSSTSSPATAGRSSRRRARACSSRCGRRRARRTLPTAT